MIVSSILLALVVAWPAAAQKHCDKAYQAIASPELVHRGLSPLPPVPPLPREASWAQVREYMASIGVPNAPLANVGPPRGRNRALPFGKFFFKGAAFDYAKLPAWVKEASPPSTPLVFYGRSVDSRAAADAMVRSYFEAGVGRGPGHYDVLKHQAETKDSLTSGFSLATDNFAVAREFAGRYRKLNGVVFVFDTTGQEILNPERFCNHAGLSARFRGEGEILSKGGRDPRSVVAAIIYENGAPVAVHNNPNYVEGPR